MTLRPSSISAIITSVATSQTRPGIHAPGPILKPLDPELIYSEWSCRVALARHHAFRGQWDEARAELSTAERLSPE